MKDVRLIQQSLNFMNYLSTNFKFNELHIIPTSFPMSEKFLLSLEVLQISRYKYEIWGMFFPMLIRLHQIVTEKRL